MPRRRRSDHQSRQLSGRRHGRGHDRQWLLDRQVLAEGMAAEGTITGKPLNEPMVGFVVS